MSALAALAALAAVPLVLAVAVPDEQSAARSTATPTAAAATQTVRDFLASAVLEDDPYAACQYLTIGAQQEVGRIAGADQTCRDALTARPPSFPGLHSEGTLRALDVRAVLVGRSTADTTVGRPRRPPVTFVLKRTVPAESAAFAARSGAWRIASARPAI